MLINNFLLPLLATIVSEACIAYLMGFRDKDSMAAIAAVNSMTNPLLNFIAMLVVYLGFGRLFYWIILPLEMLVIFAEWLILSYAIPDQKEKLFRLSAVMNISSFLIGLLIF